MPEYRLFFTYSMYYNLPSSVLFHCCMVSVPLNVQNLASKEDEHSVTVAITPTNKPLNRFGNITVCKYNAQNSSPAHWSPLSVPSQLNLHTHFSYDSAVTSHGHLAASDSITTT